MMTFGQGLPRPTAVTPTAAPAAVPAMVGPGPVAKAAEAAYAAVRKSRAPAVGTPELWHAVHVGDEITIARLIHQQLCNGPRERLQRDASGHSVLWHAIAFGHGGIAKRMLERFPVGSEVFSSDRSVASFVCGSFIRRGWARRLDRCPRPRPLMRDEASEAIPSLESLLRELDRLEHQEAKAAGKGPTCSDVQVQPWCLARSLNFTGPATMGRRERQRRRGRSEGGRSPAVEGAAAAPKKAASLPGSFERKHSRAHRARTQPPTQRRTRTHVRPQQHGVQGVHPTALLVSRGRPPRKPLPGLWPP
eukprot:g20550.t2